MTELELLELLRDVHGGYIRQADAFRQGQLRIVKKKHPMVTALQILSTAAMFVAILGADTAATAKVTLKAAVSDASSMAGAVTLDKTAEYTAQSATDADNKLLVLDVIEPGKRYVRPLIDRATANADILALLAIRYNGMGVPSEMGDVLARSVATA